MAWIIAGVFVLIAVVTWLILERACDGMIDDWEQELPGGFSPLSDDGTENPDA